MADKIRINNIIIYFSLVVSILSVLIVIFGALFFANKGFELSDETFYLFNSQKFDSTIYITQNFGILNKIACFNCPTLINLRIAKLFYQTLAIIMFCISFFAFLKSKNHLLIPVQKLLIITTALIASYINYDYLPMTMSYNSWSLIL